MWLYNGIVDGISEHCQYTRIENNAYAQPSFNESFKKDSFYSQSDPTSKSPDGYFDDPATIYKFLGSETYNGSVSFKHETYSWAKKPNSIQKICVQCNTKVGEYFDSTTGLCVNKCEDIANRRDRFNCICKRAGKLDFYSLADHVIGDDSAVCLYRCNTTKDDPEASVGEDGNLFTIGYKIHDTDPNASGVCFTDDNYIHGTNPNDPDKPDQPDKPDNPNPGGGDNPKPDDPGNNNGTKPGGGGGHPGGGSNPGNNNGTKPGNPDNNNGTKPGNDGDKDNPKMDFSGYDKLTKTVSDGVKKVTDMYGDAKNQLQGAYDKIKNGSLSDFKPSGFVASCPYTRDFVIKDGLSKKITIDICAVVKDARSVLYFIFYAIFSTIFSILLFKIIIRLV